ncbi:WD40 repeat-like protein [Rhodofomes roseus]|uniref:WD40 repeat-like protein n=1 Tax=Rhodofomes roseus TaxID=34475 RepID=A0ABQ8KH09_9APHY|nr:WD40 repeat-like protein [Rhodofomes roseus]KAH9836956.1 WD40 repeat-like protein [Rhodofomes roseus]
MPVAVDGVRPSSPSRPKDKETRQPQDVPLPETPKPSGKRKRKGKEVAETSPPSAPQITDESPWSWKSLTEESASRVPPFFTKDGRYFFYVTGSAVKIYSSTTGQVVSTLKQLSVNSFGGHQDPLASHVITSAILSPHNPFQLITGSSDGYIRLWDFLDAVLLQTINVKKPIMQVAAHESIKGYVFVSVDQGTKRKTSKAKRETSEINGSVHRVSLRPSAATAGSPVQLPAETAFVGKTRATMGLSVSPSGAWVVAIGGHKAYVCPTSNLSAGFTKFVSPQKLTCLAFHPSDDYFATGDITGCIRLWYCLDAGLTKTFGVQRTAQTTTMHWHAHAVSSVTFTTNGAYLLSGGEEAVLVIWQLHSGRKEFVPRVGAPIVHVALSKTPEGEEEYLLTLADASFVFVRSGTLKISRSIARVKIDPAMSHNRPPASTSSPLVFHARTSTIILPSSHPSSLQIYDPVSSRLVSELEVSPSNRIARRDEKPLLPARVEHAVVSDSGEWMATLDHRDPDGTFHGEVHLKIWWWDHKSEFWILNTRIERPHGLSRVSALAFRPRASGNDDLFLVTVGADGNIKSWGIRTAKQKSGNVEAFWVARSTMRYRTEVPTHVSWSADGSLFAVSVGPHVALYDGNTNALHQVLTCADCERAASAYFVGISGRHIAVVGQRDVMLWDLLTRSMRWRYTNINVVDRLVVHHTEESFAVLERCATSGHASPSSRVIILHTASPVPTAIRTLPFNIRVAMSHPSLDSFSAKPSSFVLVGITHKWSVAVFGDEVRLPEDKGSSARSIGNESVAGPSKRTLFHDIFGASALVETTPNATLPLEPDITHSWRGKEVAEIFDAPTYLMPPVTSLFDTLVDSFLTVKTSDRTAKPEEEEEEERQDEDIEMEDGTEPLITEDRIERVVNKREMEAFVDLFKNCAMREPVATHHDAPRNGLHHANGGHPPHANDVPPAAPSFAKTNGAKQSLPTPASTPARTAKEPPTSPSKTSPAVQVGQKRKKSLG